MTNQAAASATVMSPVELKAEKTNQSHFYFSFSSPGGPRLFTVGTARVPLPGPLTMVNLSRRQTMHTCCCVSGTQSLRAGGWSGGWNLAGERGFLPAELRSLSMLLEGRVCVGVLPVQTHNRGE